MACPPPGEDNCSSSDWLVLDDYDDLNHPLPPLEPNCSTIHWNHSPNPPSLGLDDSIGNSECVKEQNSRKRLRSGASAASDSKAHKEKIRRDKLNDRFQELSSTLEPGRPPKVDKVALLSDAVHMVIQLREDAQKLSESYDNLKQKVNELKTEKNELRDEKLKLKAEKERLEQQSKTLNTPPGYLAHSGPIHAPFAAPPQVFGSKLVPFVGYPGIPMLQFMPPTAVDTSEDHTLRSPVA